MTTTRLIFVEGMPGAGKSSTAARIAGWLRASGEPALAFHELADDNPIRTRGVDAMRFNHPQAKPLPGLGADGFATDPLVYDPAQWEQLAERCVDGPETIVLESRYMQNSVQPRFMGGAPIEKVYEGFAKICERVEPARPLLVYLRPTNLEAAVRSTLEERGEPWASWYLATMSNTGWARNRGITGVDAVVAFQTAWEAVAERLFASHTGPKCRVVDPQLDWSEALDEIFAAVRPA